MSDYTFEITDTATQEIAKMRDHVARIALAYGPTSEEYREANTSLTNAFGYVFGSPMAATTRIWRDGDLSLCFESLMTVGVIFHRKHRVCTHPDCWAVIADDGSTSTWSVEKAPVLDHEHTPSYPLTAPAPGSWSLHS